MAAPLQVVLKELGDEIRQPELRAVSLEVQTMLEAQIRYSFSGRRSPNGERWPKLKRKSQSRGGMQASALASIAAGHATDAGFESIDALVYYWRWQNSGNKKRNIPAREFWGIGEKTLDAATELAALEVAAALEGKGR